FQWDTKKLPAGDTIRLRISTALDSREKMPISITFPSDGSELGKMDMNFSPVFQIEELELTRAQAERVLAEGVELRRTHGESPMHIFGPADAKGALPPVLRPHLMVAGETDRWAEFMDRMEGLDTVQTFGWMEGSLFDGMWDLSKAFPERK